MKINQNVLCTEKNAFPSKISQIYCRPRTQHTGIPSQMCRFIISQSGWGWKFCQLGWSLFKLFKRGLSRFLTAFSFFIFKVQKSR